MKFTKEDFKVEIINKEEFKKFFKNFGEVASICYDTPVKFAEKVGESCLETGHLSGSRGEFVKFRITEVPRALVDEAVRHEIGAMKNVKSQRYTDSSNLNVYYPNDVTSHGLEPLWDAVVDHVKVAYETTVDKLKEQGYTNEQAREVARGLIPMNIESSFVIGFTVEAIINFMHKRLCKCSQEHIIHLAKLMKQEVVEVLPKLKPLLVPICVDKMYCPESAKRSCGMYPQRKEVEELISLGKAYRKLLEEGKE